MPVQLYSLIGSFWRSKGRTNIPMVNAPLGEQFIIGVDVQPTTSFNKWISRGINTVVRVPSGHNADDWTSAAQTAGLNMIRPPRAGAADDGDIPGLIAWALSDEPDLDGDTAASVVSAGNALRARNSRPVFLNYAGGAVLDHQGTTDQAWYETAEAGGDWICNDFYPVTGWNHPDWIPEIGEAVDILRTISPTKPQFAYIECSDQNIPNLAHRAATPGEMRAQIWLCIIAGVRGIIYFPVRLSEGVEPFSFDGVIAAGLEDEMIAQNAILNDLGTVLTTERNPAEVSITSSSPNVVVGWRVANGITYVIALNKNNATESNITISGLSGSEATVYGESRTVSIASNQLSDSFSAYEKHVYVIS